LKPFSFQINNHFLSCFIFNGGIMRPILNHLTFDGNCDDALEFYKYCFGGEILNIMRYSEAPEGSMPVDESTKNLVLHANFKSGDLRFMAADRHPAMPFEVGNQIGMNIDCDSAGQQDEIFAKLSEGGRVTMELQNTFWGARFGTLTDKYGMPWMLHLNLEQ
jgi:PhnB protein